MRGPGRIEIDADEYIALVNDRKRMRQQITDLQHDNTRLVERARLAAVGGILSGKAIERAIETGDIVIDPFVSEYINPASIDLTLGDKVLMYPEPANARFSLDDLHELDVAQKPKESEMMILAPGLVLNPGQLYLMHTRERVCTKHFVPVLDGKSSIGRLGIKVHETAGYGDPGFDGQYTLEVTTVYRTRIYAGMRIAQMRFHTLAGEHVDYRERGHYVGDRAMGPVGSRAWLQFVGK